MDYKAFTLRGPFLDIIQTKLVFGYVSYEEIGMAIEGEYYGEGDVPPDNTGKTVGVVIAIILAVLVVCLLIPLCTIVILALLGPAIGNVFSNIILGL